MADSYRRETSNKASRVNVQMQDALRLHQNRSESEHSHHLKKVLNKDSLINSKTKKKFDENRKMSSTMR